MKKGEKKEDIHMEDEMHDSWYERYIFKIAKGKTQRSWMVLLLAVLVLSIACAGLVEGCIAVAEAVHINPLFIALVLVAAASSVPDTIISMKDARKGNHNDALSNVLGSNIFDVTISLGLPLAIFLSFTGQQIPFETEGSTLIDIRVVLLLTTIVTIAIYYFSKKVNHIQVIMFGALYVLFVLYVVGAAQYHNGNTGFLAQTSGTFIEYLNKPGGLEETLRTLANKIGVGR
jgi:cation:H+ antiporter